jgi:hypothetical protein
MIHKETREIVLWFLLVFACMLLLVEKATEPNIDQGFILLDGVNNYYDEIRHTKCEIKDNDFHCTPIKQEEKHDGKTI